MRLKFLHKDESAILTKKAGVHRSKCTPVEILSFPAVATFLLLLLLLLLHGADLPHLVCFRAAVSFLGASLTYGGNRDITEPPVLPSTMRDLTNAFISCQSLTAAPVIPDGLTHMGAAFMYCTSLKTVPVIPTSVTDIGGAFIYCSSLTGQIVVNAVLTRYVDCFEDTTQPITLVGDSTVLAELAATANNGNVTVG